MRRIVFAALVTSLFATNAAVAQDANVSSVPDLIRFSGTLKSVSNSTTAPATEGITFAIYKQQDGGAPLWLETQNVTIDPTGHYTVLLGRSGKEGIPADLFRVNEERWLGGQVDGRAEQPAYFW